MGELVHEILQKAIQCHSSHLPTGMQEKCRMDNLPPNFMSNLFEGLLVNYSVQCKVFGHHDKNTAQKRNVGPQECGHQQL
jgi:hypothetical protein